MKSKDTVKVGIVGLGGRGMGLMYPLLRMGDVRIAAVCDVYEDRAEAAKKEVRKIGGYEPMSTCDYTEVIEKSGADVILVATSWQSHIEIACAAMKKGIFTAMEVGGSYDLEGCWKLVNTYEATGTPFMFLENCCYGQRELMCLNMAKEGKLGKIVHCDGAYCHDLRGEISFGRENRHYRLEHYINHNCENYPTHDLGPIAKILKINRGNRMTKLVSVASKAEGLHHYIEKHKKDDKELLDTKFKQGDVVTTVITCENGETITLTLNTTLPHPYSRRFGVHGTAGMYQEDGDFVFFEDDRKMQRNESVQWKIWRNARKYARKYDSVLWRKKSKGMKKSGHGGMDYLVLRAMVHSAKGETIPPIDVYDAVAWMCITALSEQSISQGNTTVEIPDFTQGKYKNRTDHAKGKYSLEI